jgi:hypothetical protein
MCHFKKEKAMNIVREKCNNMRKEWLKTAEKQGGCVLLLGKQQNAAG